MFDKMFLYPNWDIVVWMHAQLHGLQQVGRLGSMGKTLEVQ